VSSLFFPSSSVISDFPLEFYLEYSTILAFLLHDVAEVTVATDNVLASLNLIPTFSNSILAVLCGASLGLWQEELIHVHIC